MSAPEPGVHSIDVRLQWHSPDAAWVCSLMRDGEPWFLQGALVGWGSTPDEAVADVLASAGYLVVHGRNFLTPEPLAPADRQWLFKLLDTGVPDPGDERYLAMRRADLTGGL